MSKKVSRQIEENKRYVSYVLPIGKSFDIVCKDLLIGGKRSSFYFINGFIKDEILNRIVSEFFDIPKLKMAENAREFSERFVPYGQVDVISDFDMIFYKLLSGTICFFVDGYEEAVIIDCRSYPARSVGEPDKDKALRGSRDGFVENIIFNTALMRRRIRDPHLVMELVQVGDASRTDVAICYMEERVDDKVLQELKTRIKSIQTDALKMNQETLAEGIFKRKWYNPMPKYKFTERPDTATACLLEGKVVLIVDNSPSALILPTSILDMIEEANDYYFPTITGVYLKISRGIITFLTVFLTPVFLLFMQNPEWIPKPFSFINVQDSIHVPLVLQFLLLEMAIDGLRLAALNTPSMLSTPLSVIAGIVMGEFSVKSGWFNSEVMLYMAFVAVANYTQPNFELGYALKFMRLLLLVLTAALNLPGFLIGCIVIICAIAGNRTLSGRNYLHISKN
ncbi:spore germination protein [Lachnoclostridium sp. An181]|uniref:spore germination protein n=1 Tax=Lachnoclostridium sp. An181 TaxID=1965575 RepID=UPI000B3ACF42|nr:spore germination protein [Lachnoclostridium sp. An181]OUP50587.1 spore germination protein [Lachnoclostridium sp. An181]